MDKKNRNKHLNNPCYIFFFCYNVIKNRLFQSDLSQNKTKKPPKNKHFIKQDGVKFGPSNFVHIYCHV